MATFEILDEANVPGAVRLAIVGQKIIAGKLGELLNGNQLPERQEKPKK